jgi:hypothetical protein
VRPPIQAEEEDTVSSSSAGEGEEDLRIAENFIIGMLTNYDKMGLEKIDFMLSKFVEKPPQDLKSFLQKLVKEDKIEYSAGEYSKKQ